MADHRDHLPSRTKRFADKEIFPWSKHRKIYNLTFDEHGDVVLVLPLPNSAGTTRFQVNSNVLCLASPVFQAILGKNSSFKEAKALAAVNSGATSTPFELALDDDPNAFTIILRITWQSYVINIIWNENSDIGSGSGHRAYPSRHRLLETRVYKTRYKSKGPDGSLCLMLLLIKNYSNGCR